MKADAETGMAQKRPCQGKPVGRWRYGAGGNADVLLRSENVVQSLFLRRYVSGAERLHPAA